MFSKIKFSNEKEREEFEKYRKLKGTALYFQIYSILMKNCESIPYRQFSSYIRYDKHLRNKLYDYMATLEEYCRAQLLEHFDVASPKKYCSHCFGKLQNDLIPKTEVYSTLYYGFQPDFGDLMHICAEKDICDISGSNQKAIKDLRNDTMHHSMIMFGSARTTVELTDHFKVLENRLNAFCSALPIEYRAGFLSDISALNQTRNRGGKHLQKYYLEVQNGRICVKA